MTLKQSSYWKKIFWLQLLISSRDWTTSYILSFFLLQTFCLRLSGVSKHLTSQIFHRRRIDSKMSKRSWSTQMQQGAHAPQLQIKPKFSSRNINACPCSEDVLTGRPYVGRPLYLQSICSPGFKPGLAKKEKLQPSSHEGFVVKVCQNCMTRIPFFYNSIH